MLKLLMLRMVFIPRLEKTFCHFQVRQNPGTLHSLNHATPKWHLKISKECTWLRHPSLTSPKWVGQLKASYKAVIFHRSRKKGTLEVPTTRTKANTYSSSYT